jgi:hypothetical protein
MPRYVLIIGIVFVFLTTLQLVYASEVRKVIGKIDQVAAHSASYERYETSSKGLVFIYIKGIPKGCGFGEQRVAIGSDHPLFSTVVDMALSAKASKQTVELWYLNTCSARNGSWDFAAMWIK